MKQLSSHRYRCVLVLIFVVFNILPICSQTVTVRYQVAACDWMMLKRQKLGEFKLAHELEADGVEVDMGGLGNRILFDNQLRNPEQAKKFQAAAHQYGVAVPSMAMSGFFAQSFLSRENYQDLLADCFQTMKLFGSKVACPWAEVERLGRKRAVRNTLLWYPVFAQPDRWRKRQE